MVRIWLSQVLSFLIYLKSKRQDSNGQQSSKISPYRMELYTLWPSLRQKGNVSHGYVWGIQGDVRPLSAAAGPRNSTQPRARLRKAAQGRARPRKATQGEKIPLNNERSGACLGNTAPGRRLAFHFQTSSFLDISPRVVRRHVNFIASRGIYPYSVTQFQMASLPPLTSRR